MKLVSCTFPLHAEAILEILNDVIMTSTTIYDYNPRTMDYMRQWFDEKTIKGHPVIGAESDDGNLLGFATYGAFRVRPAYKYSIEHSLYVHKDHRGKGIGRELLKRLIEMATEQNYHLIIGGIDAANQPSISFHEALGFTHVGTFREAGFKFGRWLDLAFYQLTLPTPKDPVDG